MWQSYCAIRRLGRKENNFLLTIFPSPFSFSPHPHPTTYFSPFPFCLLAFLTGFAKINFILCCEIGLGLRKPPNVLGRQVPYPPASGDSRRQEAQLCSRFARLRLSPSPSSRYPSCHLQTLLIHPTLLSHPKLLFRPKLLMLSARRGTFGASWQIGRRLSSHPPSPNVRSSPLLPLTFFVCLRSIP